VSSTGVFVGDVGTELRFDVGVPTQDMVMAQVKVVKPGKTVDTWVLTQGPGENEVSYITVNGDIDISGKWNMQVYIEFPTWKGYGNIANMTVNKIL